MASEAEKSGSVPNAHDNASENPFNQPHAASILGGSNPIDDVPAERTAEAKQLLNENTTLRACIARWEEREQEWEKKEQEWEKQKDAFQNLVAEQDQEKGYDKNDIIFAC